MHDVYYMNYDDNIDRLSINLYTFLLYNNKLHHNIHMVYEESNLPTPQHIEQIEKIYPVIWSNTQIIENAIHPFLIENIKHEAPIDILPKKVAVVYHVHYPEQVSKTLKRLDRLSRRVTTDVFLYHTCQEINKYIPKNINSNVTTMPIENLGRDIRSFLQFIHNNMFEPYDMVLKIHTKDTHYLDRNWRDQFESYLIDSFNTCFGHMLSCNEHIHSVKKFKILENIDNTNNSHSMSRLYDFFSINNKKTQYTFYAGTMFWCDKVFCKLLKKLIDMHPTVTDLFEPEPLIADGTMAHAWERFLGQLPDFIE
jgi:lipopolysaccharide biosynthesis protein